MSTVYRDDEFDILQSHAERIGRLEQGCPPFILPPEEQFMNGWHNAGAPYELWGYRICDGQLEFQGHLTPGSSGTAAYTFPADYLIMFGNLSWPTDIVIGAGFTIARVEIVVTSGQLIITYPAS